MLLLLMMRCSVEMLLLHQLLGRVLLKVLFVRPFVLLEITVPDAGVGAGSWPRKVSCSSVAGVRRL